MQYCLKLYSTAQNPAFSAVFGGKFKSAFDRKPNQIPPLGIRVQPDLHAIGFKQKDILQSATSATPPWLLDYLRVNFDLHLQNCPVLTVLVTFHVTVAGI